MVFFTLVARHLLLLTRPFDTEKVSRKTDLAQTQIKPGLNVDNLPLVKIDYGKYKPASDVPGLDASVDDGLSLAEIRQQCLTRGFFLGPEVATANCSKICDVDPSAVEFAFISLWDANRIIAARQRLSPGGYCMPTKMSTCNRNTSLVVYTLAGWSCMPMGDAFAGEGGNRIVVCNGSLRDNALRVVHREFIPPNLAFTNVYSDMLADGTYRFECPRADRDQSGNKYVVSPLNRLHAIRNWCTATIPFAADVTVDLINGKCHCGSEGLVEDKHGRCSACRIKFDSESKTISFSPKPCYSFIDPVDMFEARVKELREELSDGEVDSRVTIFPCGYNNQGNASEYTLPRCLDFYVAAYSPALPSHNTLQTVDSFTK